MFKEGSYTKSFTGPFLIKGEQAIKSRLTHVEEEPRQRGTGCFGWMMYIFLIFFSIGTLYVFFEDEQLKDTSLQQSNTPESNIKTPYKLVGSKPGGIPKVRSYWVYINISGVDNKIAYQDSKSIAKKLCKGKDICLVHYFDKEEKAGNVFKMSNSELGKYRTAVYSITRSTGRNKLSCHPFGETNERCDS